MNKRFRYALIVMPAICSILIINSFNIEAKTKDNKIVFNGSQKDLSLETNKQKDSIKVDIKTSLINNSASQQYELILGKDIDLSKLRIEFYYDEKSGKEQRFWCDHAGISFEQAPWYTDISTDVNTQFNDGYVDIKFMEKDYNQGIDKKVVIDARITQDDWSNYIEFKELGYRVFYNDKIVLEEGTLPKPTSTPVTTEVPTPTSTPVTTEVPTPTSTPTSTPEPTEQPKPTSTPVVEGIQYHIPSLKNVYKDKFLMGVAVPTHIINNEKDFALITKHFNSITHENDMKPQSLLGNNPNIGNDGWPILDFSNPNKVLDKVVSYNKEHQDNPIKMRGHVLVWHNQAPEWFFREDFNGGKPYVTKDTMNKRLEWYIKSVMEYYYNDNSPYKDIIYAWDVVNEAINPEDNCPNGIRKTNGANTTAYYNVYGESNEYIINAFTYANKYAPEDVKLFYNDYNAADTKKADYICNLIEEIQNTDGARIDGMGMQSHFTVWYPNTKLIEDAIRKYAAKGIEIQITELDMKNDNAHTPTYEELSKQQEKRFEEIFEVFNRLKDEGINITSITMWGLKDDQSWLTMPQYSEGKKHYPLLFDKDYQAKPEYWAVVNAAE